jgi:hypothetical protein
MVKLKTTAESDRKKGRKTMMSPEKGARGPAEPDDADAGAAAEPQRPADPPDARERAARALENKAESGDVSAIKAVADGVADRLRRLEPEKPAEASPISPYVAEAMYEAGLAASEGRAPHVIPDDPWAWYHAADPPQGYHRANRDCPTCGRPPDRPGLNRPDYGLVPPTPDATAPNGNRH